MKPYIVLQVADDYFNFANTMGKAEVIQMNQTKSKRYGYVRVSTKEQNEDRQLLAMQQVGIPDWPASLSDKQSGKDFDRPAYRRLLHVLQGRRHSGSQEHRPARQGLRRDHRTVALHHQGNQSQTSRSSICRCWIRP